MHSIHNFKPKKTFYILTVSLICLLFFTQLFTACGSIVSSKPTSETSSQMANSSSTESTGISPQASDDSSSDGSDTLPGDSHMEIHFLDVGQGLSILVMSEDEVLIYDGGDSEYSVSVVAHLKKLGIEKIDYLISSHYDSDHICGLIGCLYAFDVETVIGADYVHNSSLYESFQNAVANQSLTVTHPPVGTTYDFGSGSFTILSPDTTYNDSNNNSIAIKLSNGEHDFIFMGDAEYESESAMVNSGMDLSCDVLCLGHHGSASSTSWDLLQAVVPEFAVISCGAGNAHGHPHEETMEKLSSMEIPVFRTDIQGTIIASSDGTSLSWNVRPCNDYSSGDDTKTDTSESSEATGPAENTDASEDSDSTVCSYILNTSTQKFHQPDCNSVKKMSAQNKQEFSGTREDLIEMGYEPCGNCNP